MLVTGRQDRPTVVGVLVFSLFFSLTTAIFPSVAQQSNAVSHSISLKHHSGQHTAVPAHTKAISQSPIGRHKSVHGVSSTPPSTGLRRHARGSSQVGQSSRGTRHRSAHGTPISQHKTAEERTISRRQGHRHSRVATESASVEHKKTAQKAKDKEEEAEEPPSVRVDFEELERGYSHYDSGVNKRLSGDFASAIKELQDARQIFHEHGKQESPMETFASLELAKTAEEAGNYALARRTYEECRAKSPSFAPVRLKLAQLEAKNGDFNEALIEAREACNLEPNSAEAHLVLSLILEHTGAGAEAMVEKQRAMQLAGEGAPN
jgi:hypothetical protein